MERPEKAINPYLDPAELAPVSALSNLITLYAADNEQEQLRREALSNEVWERYFYNESRDPVQREMEQDQLISRAKMAREQQQFNPDLVIVADVSAQPAHISKPLLERINYFEGWASRRHIPAICVKPSGRVLNARSACVPAGFCVIPFYGEPRRAGGLAGPPGNEQGAGQAFIYPGGGTHEHVSGCCLR